MKILLQSIQILAGSGRLVFGDLAIMAARRL
jgi:hypothetical protein